MKRMKDIDPNRCCRLCARVRREDDREDCRRRHYRGLNNLAGIGVIRFPKKEEAEIVKCRDFKPRARVCLLNI